MRKLDIFLSAAAAVLVTACSGGSGESEDTDLTQATTDNEAEVLQRALPAGDFADLKLGAKVAGPLGQEVEDALSNSAGNFADMRAYVACPDGMTTCDPNTAPKGTVYTYVLVVIPGEDNQGDSGSGPGPDDSHVESAGAFSMTRPALGFTGKAGYSKAEAYAAVGKAAEVTITCDAGQLTWTINAGDGGNQWESQEPITFWWQSTLPPAGLADAYRIHTTFATASGKGPYPGKTADSANTCEKVEYEALVNSR